MSISSGLVVCVSVARFLRRRAFEQHHFAVSIIMTAVVTARKKTIQNKIPGGSDASDSAVLRPCAPIICAVIASTMPL